MQGATIEHATVVAAPHDLTRGWSYTALSRARDETRVLLRDTSPEAGNRDAIGPTAAAAPAARPVDVLARAASRMRERDDEDLAIDQLPAAGQPNDPQLRRPQAPSPLQEHAAARADSAIHAEPGPARMRELRDALQQLGVQLAALPVRELDQLDNLDARAIELTERRDTLRGNLDRVPDPPRRRFGRQAASHIVKRTQLSSAHRGIEAQLDRVLVDRTALARLVGDVESIRSERDGLTSAIAEPGCVVIDQRRGERDPLAGSVDTLLDLKPLALERLVVHVRVDVGHRPGLVRQESLNPGPRHPPVDQLLLSGRSRAGSIRASPCSWHKLVAQGSGGEPWR
jgi:hypothetical protein